MIEHITESPMIKPWKIEKKIYQNIKIFKRNKKIKIAYLQLHICRKIVLFHSLSYLFEEENYFISLSV